MTNFSSIVSPQNITVHFLSSLVQTLQPGPPVSLKCSARGSPTPRVAWTLNGFSLPKSERFLIGQYVTVHGDVVSHVNISRSRVEDGGRYECKADNRAGKVEHGARLNIYGERKYQFSRKSTNFINK